jgi:hypothetical protein
MTLGQFSRPFGTYGNREFEPGSELPGYSQISLREKLEFDQSKAEKCPNSRGRRDACPTLY